MSQEKDLITQIVACHLYKADADKFKGLCREKGLFHAEVLRNLLLKWCKKQEEGKAEEVKEKGSRPPFVEDWEEDEEEDL